MKKSEFIDLVAEKAETSKAAAGRVVDAIFGTAGGAISEAVRTAGNLNIPGFGKFSTRKRAARKGRNPRTGATIDIPERTSVAFTPGKGLKDAMEGKATKRASKTGAKSRTASSARTSAKKTTTAEKGAGKPAAKKASSARTSSKPSGGKKTTGKKATGKK